MPKRSTPQPAITPRTRASRLFEMATVFFVLPAAAAALVDPVQRFGPILERLNLEKFITLPLPLSGLVFPSLFALSLPLLFALLGDAAFQTKQLWNAKAFLRDAKRMFRVLPFGFILLVLLAFGFERFGVFPEGRGPFGLLKQAPLFAILIFVFYPWLLCYPQEISHRVFFFHRYSDALGPTWVQILVNAAAFSWLHAPFWNPWALAMTFVGGLLFAWTWLRTRSALAVTIEHGLYGWWAFVSGAGWFVYAGSLNN